MVCSRWERRPFCIPPPKNCSFAPRTKTCVVSRPSHTGPTASSQITVWSSGR